MFIVFLALIQNVMHLDKNEYSQKSFSLQSTHNLTAGNNNVLRCATC